MADKARSSVVKVADSLLVIGVVIVAALIALWLFKVVVGIVLTVVKVGVVVAIILGLGYLLFRIFRGRS